MRHLCGAQPGCNGLNYKGLQCSMSCSLQMWTSCAGNAPLSVGSIANLATDAAVDIASNTTINAGAFASTFGQLPEVVATPNATILQGFAQALLSNIAAQAQSSSRALGVELTPALLSLASASGLHDTEQLFSSAFSQVCLSFLTMYTCLWQNCIGQQCMCRSASCSCMGLGIKCP